MRKQMGFVLANVMLAAAPGASASIVRQGVEVFYPNSAPRGDVVVHEGDVLLRLSIMWARAARIDQPIVLTVAGKTTQLAAGALLPEVQLILPDHPSDTIAGFCTPLRHGERTMEHGLNRVLFGNGILARKIAEHATSGQFCLFDRAGDGRFDEVRYFDSGLTDGSSPEKIAPVPYVKLVNAPVSLSNQDEVRVTVGHISHHSLALSLDIVQAGVRRIATSVSIGGFSVKIMPSLTLTPFQLGKEFDLDLAMPQVSEVLGVDFEIVAVAPNGGAATVRFPENVDRNRVLPIPEETNVRFCPYGC